jgi:hypothetical protein
VQPTFLGHVHDIDPVEFLGRYCELVNPVAPPPCRLANLGKHPHRSFIAPVSKSPCGIPGDLSKLNASTKPGKPDL